LLTIAGGKWTTYRKMAEDCVDVAARRVGLAPAPCVTRSLRIHGYSVEVLGEPSLQAYGTDAPAMVELMQRAEHCEPLTPELPITSAHFIWAVRNEMARTVDDVLARRTRSLHLNARAAIAIAPRVAHLMAGELTRDSAWEREQVEIFTNLARQYLPGSDPVEHSDTFFHAAKSL
ncbi:MAG: FAD-dependent oxidoreductase, partial [Burkholderiales bacterium]|nr:FAD-dependent oxidoreductase [Phycisphaerae bacterium]